jgi:hypothetical protein
MDSVPATITDDILLARRYFQEAVTLNPADARTLGFLTLLVNALLRRPKPYLNLDLE